MKSAFFAVLAACFLLIPLPVLAVWSSNGNLICGSPGWQVQPLIISDGADGALIAWADGRNGNYDVYAQRIDSDGKALWISDGVAVCTASGDQYDIELVSDGIGGAIITWHDGRSPDRDIYVQRIDDLGAPLWTTNGVAVCAVSGHQEFPKITTDGAGGAIIAWQDFRSPDGGIYVQRMDAGGIALWDANGVPACSAAGDQYRPAVVSDGVGGAIVAWYDSRAGSNDIYAQRIDGAGLTQWTLDGVALCTAPGDQQVGNNFFYATADGAGGAIIAWRDQRDGNWDIYAQKVTAGGVVAWAIDGEEICKAVGDQILSEVASDGFGGAFIAWDDARGADRDVYAQRIDTNGNVQWAIDGVEICTMAEDQYYPKIIPDETGGAILMWRDARYFPPLTHIFAQRVDAAGSVLWQNQGIEAGLGAGTQAVGHLMSDGEGGAITVWYDYRNENDYNIYANKVPPTVPDYAPNIVSIQDVPNDQGGKLSIRWEKSALDVTPETYLTEYTVWRRLELTVQQLSSGPADSLGALGGSARVGEQPRHVFANGYAWEWLANVPARYFDVYALTVQSLYDSLGTNAGWQFFIVSAQSWDPSVFFDSEVDSGYSVDNLSPSTPQSFAGEIVSSQGLVLSWDANTETDLHHYEVYRGPSKDFTPDEGNLIAETTSTTATDEEWAPGSSDFYKLLAVDVHGNKSDCASVGFLDITGVDPKVQAFEFALRQNHPNPFNPSTRIDFILDRAGNTSLKVYDISGGLVRTLFGGHKTAGIHAEEWNGRDDQGKSVASGVYFYRLTSQDRELTQKMIFLK